MLLTILLENKSASTLVPVLAKHEGWECVMDWHPPQLGPGVKGALLLECTNGGDETTTQISIQGSTQTMSIRVYIQGDSVNLTTDSTDSNAFPIQGDWNQANDGGIHFHVNVYVG